MIDFSRWIFEATQATHKIALDRQAKLLAQFLINKKNHDEQEVYRLIDGDYTRITGTALFFNNNKNHKKEINSHAIKGTKRQLRHQ